MSSHLPWQGSMPWEVAVQWGDLPAKPTQAAALNPSLQSTVRPVEVVGSQHG